MGFYDYEAMDIDGNNVSMQDYEGKVVLVVNTASKCGYTPQFEGLEQLYKDYKDRGFEVLGFPCNQFGGQDPGSDEEILGFCELNYGVTFKMFSKVKVNGKEAHPLWVYLKEAQGGVLGDRIKWNFTKFLIDREGNVIERFASATKPEEIRGDIEALLK
ncbi:MAG: glutathione peroxidase [Tissierellia bacterium]|nr:glutathione peroxidase [Tissierellia bacterium]